MTADRGEDHHVRTLLGAYALDALDAEESRLVEAHLRTCPLCAADYAEVADAVSLLALLNEEDLSE
ncbi:MAG TPA: zf-HC2 domain-containing protein [Streptomyces sp.]|jgi:Predicted transmembrane transcriptional regulator (anti-sigma factor)